jgi:hypothetical protein
MPNGTTTPTIDTHSLNPDLQCTITDRKVNSTQQIIPETNLAKSRHPGLCNYCTVRFANANVKMPTGRDGMANAARRLLDWNHRRHNRWSSGTNALRKTLNPKNLPNMTNKVIPLVFSSQNPPKGVRATLFMVNTVSILIV